MRTTGRLHYLSKALLPIAAVLTAIAFNCLVRRADCRATDILPTGNTAVTFNTHIAKIIYAKCASCHHDGEIAPFSLMSYDDARKRAETIEAVVCSGYMPPWKPVPNFGNFQNCRALSADEVRAIKTWVRAGAPEGPRSQAPAPPIFSSSRWRLGEPDLVLTMAETFQVPADGPDVYRCFVIPSGLTEDRYVRAVEFKPGNRKVVHHALFFLDNSGAARKKDRADKQPGFASFGGPGFLPSGGLGGWAPGNLQAPLPDGIARVIRAGADLVVQEHFHPTGKVEEERLTIGIYFSKVRPQRLIVPLVVRSRKINIPPGVKSHKVSATFKLPIDMQVINVVPHAHLLAKEIKAIAHTPSGGTVPLIWIKNWDFNQQEQYTYDSPIKMRRGTTIEAEFIYDNSQDNPRNPNHPPRRVKWGEQTTDEMAILFFGAIAENQDDMPKYVRAMLRRNAPLLLQGSPGQWLFAARQILKPDKRFGRVLPEDGEQGPKLSQKVRTSAEAPAGAIDTAGGGTKRAGSDEPRSVFKLPEGLSDAEIMKQIIKETTPPNRNADFAVATEGISLTVDCIGGQQIRAGLGSRDDKPTVLLFLGLDCPISNRYSPQIKQMVQQFGNHVNFIATYTDRALSESKISSHAQNFGFTIPLAFDKSGELRRRCGITITPEVAVIDARGTLVYRGRIDNRYITLVSRREEATEHDLRDVLDSLLQGKNLTPRFTKSVGCIKSNN